MLQQTTEIVKRAEKIFLSNSFSVSEKETISDLVTTNDTAIQNFLCLELKKIYGDIEFICEESSVHEKSALQHEYTAIIDPIDGTANYIMGFSECAISVAVYKNGKPFIGIVDLPRISELYAAECQNGAFLNGIPIHVSNHDFAHSYYLTGFCNYNKSLSEPCFKISKELFGVISDIRRFGSSASDLSSIAAGKGDLFFEPRLFPWDFAAAAIILRESGGYCCNIDINLLENALPQPFYAANSIENLGNLKSIVLKHLTAEYYENGIYKQ